MPTHYEVLGVQPTSEQEVIEGAYKALIRKYHPDRAGDNQRIRLINAAYSVLKNPLKRRAYDVSLKLFPSRELVVHERKPEKRAFEDSTRSAPGRREKKCPDCFEAIALEARVCRYCGHRFVAPHKSERQPGKLGCGIALALISLFLLMIFLVQVEEVPSDEAAGDFNVLSSTEAGLCGPESIRLNLGRVEPSGTLELLATKLDTDGYNRLVVGLNGGTCIQRAELDELARATGESGPTKLLIGHDPKGSLFEFRNRFTYETDGLTPLSETPMPPADMHFGEAIWDASSNPRQLTISWYDNFRRWLESKFVEHQPEPDAVTEPQGKAAWTDVGLDGPYKISVDIPGIVVDPPNATFWMKSERRVADDSPQPFTLIRGTVDCRSQTFKALATADYDASGEYIGSSALSGAEEQIAPSTNLATVTEPICAAIRW